jgi:hypothetical protein
MPMKTKRLMFYCLAGLLAGCVPIVSLHPLFTKETIVFEEKLLGTWLADPNDPNNAWEFSRLEAGAAEYLPDELKESAATLYRLNIVDEEGHKGSLVACLVKLQDHLLLDVLPDKYPSGQQDPEKMKLLYNAFLFIQAHTFVRVDAIGDQLKLRLTDNDKFKALVEAEPNAVGFTEGQETFILTASTKELQAFVVKYINDERLFPTELAFVRKGQ